MRVRSAVLDQVVYQATTARESVSGIRTRRAGRGKALPQASTRLGSTTVVIFQRQRRMLAAADGGVPAFGRPRPGPADVRTREAIGEADLFFLGLLNNVHGTVVGLNYIPPDGFLHAVVWTLVQLALVRSGEPRAMCARRASAGRSTGRERWSAWSTGRAAQKPGPMPSFTREAGYACSTRRPRLHFGRHRHRTRPGTGGRGPGEGGRTLPASRKTSPAWWFKSPARGWQIAQAGRSTHRGQHRATSSLPPR